MNTTPDPATHDDGPTLDRCLQPPDDLRELLSRGAPVLLIDPQNGHHLSGVTAEGSLRAAAAALRLLGVTPSWSTDPAEPPSQLARLTRTSVASPAFLRALRSQRSNGDVKPGR